MDSNATYTVSHNYVSDSFVYNKKGIQILVILNVSVNIDV